MSDNPSPFLEGVFHIAFENSDPIPDPTLAGLFYNLVQKDYPTIQPSADLAMEFPLGPGQFEFQQTPITRFISDNNSLVQVGKNNFIFNHLPPYRPQIEVKAEILRLLDLFVQLNKNQKVRFIQLRMINKFEVSSSDRLAELINLNIPKLPLAEAASVSSVHVNTESIIGDDVGFIRLQSHPSSLPDMKLYLLEFGFTHYLATCSLEDVSSWLDRAYDICVKMYLETVKQ